MGYDEFLWMCNEYCWDTGEYTSDCCCAVCDHRGECYDSDVDEFEDEELDYSPLDDFYYYY